jgi:hypothetical protein
MGWLIEVWENLTKHGELSGDCMWHLTVVFGHASHFLLVSEKVELRRDMSRVVGRA